MSIETKFDIPLVAGLALGNEQANDYDVIACIAGSNFKVHPEDIRQLHHATYGKVFTLTIMHLLIKHTRIHEYRVG